MVRKDRCSVSIPVLRSRCSEAIPAGQTRPSPHCVCFGIALIIWPSCQELAREMNPILSPADALTKKELEETMRTMLAPPGGGNPDGESALDRFTRDLTQVGGGEGVGGMGGVLGEGGRAGGGDLR